LDEAEAAERLAADIADQLPGGAWTAASRRFFLLSLRHAL
jgi:hypothetical protein